MESRETETVKYWKSQEFNENLKCQFMLAFCQLKSVFPFIKETERYFLEAEHMGFKSFSEKES